MLLFVLPKRLGRQSGVNAQWLAAATFADALGRRLGGAHFLTPEGLMSPAEAAALVAPRTGATHPARLLARSLPGQVRVGLGDVAAWRRGRTVRGLSSTVTGPYDLVVQMHGRFQDVGLRLAERLGVPSVLRVEAIEVREEAAWGLPRPGWGRMVEALGEFRVMRRADLIVSVSDSLDAQIAAAGIADERRAMIPNGVDVERFSPGEPDAGLLRSHGLEGRLVIGWVGGFRPFHGLELVPAIAQQLRRRVPGAILCLLGAGPLLARITNDLRGMEDVVRLLPPVAPAEVPRWIGTFDMCVLLSGGGSFHYSPLKLYEYLACGRPVVAAAVGQVPQIVRHEEEALLVPPGSPDAVVGAVERLSRDGALRRRLGESGRRTAETSYSWDARARQLAALLAQRGLLPKVPRAG